MSCEKCNSTSMKQLRAECQEAKDYALDMENENDKLRRHITRYDRSEKKFEIKLSLDDITAIGEQLEKRLDEIKDDAEEYIRPEGKGSRKAFLESNHLNELLSVLE